MEQDNWHRVARQEQETAVLRKEISELRSRLLARDSKIEPTELPESTIGSKHGTLGDRFKSLTRFKPL
jgi:hypothetical protein